MEHAEEFLQDAFFPDLLETMDGQDFHNIINLLLAIKLVNAGGGKIERELFERLFLTSNISKSFFRRLFQNKKILYASENQVRCTLTDKIFGGKK
jgi:hypothetical protein